MEYVHCEELKASAEVNEIERKESAIVLTCLLGLEGSVEYYWHYSYYQLRGWKCSAMETQL